MNNTFITSDYNFEIMLICFYKNILNITKEPFLYIKSQLFRKPDLSVKFNFNRFQHPKIYKKHLPD